MCSDGERSCTAARYLNALGMTTVAAMNGGMQLWRQEGFTASRDPSIIEHVLQAPAPGNGSDGRPLKAKKGERRLTVERITEHVGDVSKVRKVKLAAFLTTSQTSCVDGREDRAIIGTPGGDAGELVLGLAAAEIVSGGQVDLGHVPELTRAFADTFGGIYLHTDNHALNHLARTLKGDSRLEAAVTPLYTIDDWEEFLRRPPMHLRDALLEHLIEPDNIGCGHLKLALLNSDAYKVRPGIVREVFRAFYRGLWDGAADLEWVVLGGDHAEGAVVNVTVERDLWPFSQVPMLSPSVGGVQMFVNHPQVVTFIREQTARFLSTTVENLLPIGKDASEGLLTEIPKLGGVQATETLVALAGGLPTFSVHFDANGKSRRIAGR